MKLLRYTLFGLLAALAAASFYYLQQKKEEPRVFTALLIDQYDEMAPLFLRTIQKLDYDKSRMVIEIHLQGGSDKVRDTAKDWIDKNKGSYASTALVDERFYLPDNASTTDKNRLSAWIKDNVIKSSKDQHCDYCFIVSSDTILSPNTLQTLVNKHKPVIAPLLRPLSHHKDPYRNFFAAVTDNGYYKDDPEYLPIANRNKTGTHSVPCVHKAYLIDSSYADKLSFIDNFKDWEFLSFSKNARDNGVEQFVCNEDEFGFFLHSDGKMANEEKKSYSIADKEMIPSRLLLAQSIDPYVKDIPSIQLAAAAFPLEDYIVVKIPEKGLLAVKDVDQIISRHYLKMGDAFDDTLSKQFEKYARSGTDTVIIGDINPENYFSLSDKPGNERNIQVFATSDTAFIETAINKQLNGMDNIALHKIPESYGANTSATAKKSLVDNLQLKNLSFIAIQDDGSDSGSIAEWTSIVKKYRPVVLLFQSQKAGKGSAFKEFLSLGYLYTPIGNKALLFIPAEMSGVKEGQMEPQSGGGDLQQAKERDDTAARRHRLHDDQHSPIHVSWEGTFLDFHSISHVNRTLTEAVVKYPHIHLGYNGVSNDWVKPLKNLSEYPELVAMEERMKNGDNEAPDITVRHSWPWTWNRPEKGKVVMIQPWEYGRLPMVWVEGFKNMDEIWVPTTYVKQVYEDSGVPGDKVFVVPNGIDPTIFHQGIDPYKLATKKKFKFLYLGGTIHRKGADVLLKSYLQAFKDTDDVCLVFKDFGTKSTYINQTLTDTILEAAKQPGSPEILYFDDNLNVDEIAAIYAACDCLVYPYRGEGFAMPVLEAMACGIPVIVTEGGATDDFVTNDCGWKIPSKKYSMGDELWGWKLVGDGWLLEPDSEILSATMLWVAEHPEAARKKGAAAAKIAAENWTWDNAAEYVVERLEALEKRSNSSQNANSKSFEKK